MLGFADTVDGRPRFTFSGASAFSHVDRKGLPPSRRWGATSSLPYVAAIVPLSSTEPIAIELTFEVGIASINRFQDYECEATGNADFSNLIRLLIRLSPAGAGAPGRFRLEGSSLLKDSSASYNENCFPFCTRSHTLLRFKRRHIS